MTSKSFQIGNKFGRLTVLRFTATKDRRGWNTRYAVCECSCGGETTVLLGNLGGRRTKSCGCLGREKLKERHRATGNKKIGKTYGRLTVIRKAGLSKRGIMTFVCRCYCGKGIIVEGGNLVAGHYKSCGCMRWDRKAFRKPKGESGFSQLISNLKGGARSRGHEWNLTDDDVRRITKENCHYCGKEPSQVATCGYKNASIEAKKHSEYIYNGLDRANNDLGYTLENVVPCCMHCNRAKRMMTQEEFREWIVRTYRHLDNWEVKE